MASQIPALPPELVAMIFSNLPNATQAVAESSRIKGIARHPKTELCMCAQSCHTWREIARPFLFREVAVTFRANLSKEVDYTQETIGFGVDEYLSLYKPLAEFTQFLTDNPLIARCVRKLVLCLRTDHARNKLLGDFFVDPSPSDMAILLNSTTLPSLRHLELLNVLLNHPKLALSGRDDTEDEDSIEDPEQWEFAIGQYRAVIPHLDRAYIHYNTWARSFLEPRYMRLLLSIFTSADELFLGETKLDIDDDIDPLGEFDLMDGKSAIIPEHVQIKNLIIDNFVPSFPILYASAHLPGSPLAKLASLDMSFNTRGTDLYATSHFLEDFGASLVRLSLDVEPNLLGDMGIDSFDLSQCRQMEILTLAVDLYPTEEKGYEYQNNNSFSFIANTLPTCSRLPALTCITIIFGLGFGLTYDPDTAIFETSTDEIQEAERVLIELMDSTPLKEVAISPLPNPFRFDYNILESFDGAERNCWRVSDFPELVFPKLRDMGKLKDLGE